MREPDMCCQAFFLGKYLLIALPSRLKKKKLQHPELWRDVKKATSFSARWLILLSLLTNAEGGGEDSRDNIKGL